MRGLWIAVGFLTRIPVGDPSQAGKRDVRVSSAVPWFPLVGAAIGAISGLAWLGLSEVTTPLVAAALATALAALITGAFHHDGLADIADAFGGGWTVEQRMEILKDSRLGTYGTSALTLAYIIEIAALSSLDPTVGFQALIAAHIVGRALAIVAMLISPVGGDGLGAAYISELSKPAAWVSVVASFAAGAALLGSNAILGLPLAVVAAIAVVLLARSKIGGITGDVLGAITVVSLVTTLVTATF